MLDALPGEAAPKLALALCAARKSDPEPAARYYATVWRTDLSYVSAAFGLARARFALGDISGTVTTLEAAPESSRYAVPAQLCAILARARGCATGQPPLADFFTAAELAVTLDLDERRRTRAIAEVLETTLKWEQTGRPWPHGLTASIPATLLGHPLNQRGLRNGLGVTYRDLARLAPTRAERIACLSKGKHYQSALRSTWRRIWS